MKRIGAPKSITIYFKNGDAVEVKNVSDEKNIGNVILKDGIILIKYNNNYYTLTGQQL